MNFAVPKAGKMSYLKNQLTGADSQGRPTIKTTGCSASIDRVDVSLHRGASWLYRIFEDQINSAFKKQMVEVVRI